MYYNQELGLCIEFGPVRVDSVRRGGGPPPPWIKSPLRRFTPSWTSTRVTCDCLLPFVHPLLSQVEEPSNFPPAPIAPRTWVCSSNRETIPGNDPVKKRETHPCSFKVSNWKKIVVFGSEFGGFSSTTQLIRSEPPPRLRWSGRGAELGLHRAAVSRHLAAKWGGSRA